MAELERQQPDHRAAFALDMAQGGRIHPLNEDELRNFREDRDGVFGPSRWDTPNLTGELPFTFTSLPSPAAVENAIKSDIGGENHFRFAPSRGSPEEDANAIMHLLDNIGNVKYSEPGAVIHMQSPTFNQKKRWIPGWEGDGILGQSEFQMTVAPSGQVFELEYYEHHFSTTLLTGSKVWFTFPPLQANLNLLRTAYEGQTLLLPPYWSCMIFCTETSTSCSFSLSTAAQYIYRIKHMGLWLSHNLFWDTGEQLQSHLVRYVTELAAHFASIITGDLKRFKVGPVQNQICSEWLKPAPKQVEESKSMKEKIGVLLSLIEDEEARERE
ncbi:hypothetical protein J4E91_005704 [Alternaria rosae]|nr:hypothetical protein J4E91_005704 [Alternaria rosae]